MMKTRTAPLTCTRAGRSKRPNSLFSRVLTLLSIHRERNKLTALDDHMLKDIGLTREDAQKESKRPIWDAPDRWLR